MQLPLTISDGRIGKMNLKLGIPGSNSELKIENVFIRVVSLRESNATSPSEDPDQATAETDFKTQRIKDWEAKSKKYFDDIKSASWVKTYLDNFLQNAKIDVNHLVILFENREDESNPFAFRIKLDRLQIIPVDGSWVSGYTNENEHRRKLIDVDQLSLSVFFVSRIKEKDGKISKAFNNQKMFNKNLHDNDSSSQEKNYIVLPMKFQIKLTLNSAPNTDYHLLPKTDVEILMKSPIVISICKEQIETVMRCIDSFDVIMKMKANLHLRPIIRPAKHIDHSGKDWWKYAIMAVIEKNRNKVNIFSVFEKYFVVRKYISLYKRLKKFVGYTSYPGASTLVEGFDIEGSLNSAELGTDNDLARDHSIQRVGTHRAQIRGQEIRRFWHRSEAP